MQTIRQVEAAFVHNEFVAHLWPDDAVNEMIMRHGALENCRSKAAGQAV